MKTSVDDEVLDHAPRLRRRRASAANSASASATRAGFAKQGSNALTTPSKFV